MMKEYPQGIKTMYYWIVNRWDVYPRDIFQIKRRHLSKPLIVIDLYESDYWFLGQDIMDFFSYNAIDYEGVMIMDSEFGEAMCADCAKFVYWVDEEP